jgi:hypothetical protein
MILKPPSEKGRNPPLLGSRVLNSGMKKISNPSEKHGIALNYFPPKNIKILISTGKK